MWFREVTARFKIGLNEPSCSLRNPAIGDFSKRYKTIEISWITSMASGDFTKRCQIPAIEGQQIPFQIGDHCFQIDASNCHRMNMSGCECIICKEDCRIDAVNKTCAGACDLADLEMDE